MPSTWAGPFFVWLAEIAKVILFSVIYNMANNKEKRIRKRQHRHEREREQTQRQGEAGEGLEMGEAMKEMRRVVEEEERREQKQIERKVQEAEGGIVWGDLPSCTTDESTLLLIGPRNCGKSTLSAHLLSLGNTAVLDCDLGRNATLEGCVSLLWPNNSLNIWVGEFSPLNQLQTYLQAIRSLHAHYRQHLFKYKLVVNTMGYTTGLGELLLYELFQIIQPPSILSLQLLQTQKFGNVDTILGQLDGGQYVKRLYLSEKEGEREAASVKVWQLVNEFAKNKKEKARLQRHFEGEGQKIDDISTLLKLIKTSHYKGSPYSHHPRQQLKIYQQTRHGQQGDAYTQLSPDQQIQMRLVVLGTPLNPLETGGLMQAQTIGFGLDGAIYVLGQWNPAWVGVVSEGLDFQKGFYHLNEKQMLELQLRWGRIPYLTASATALGSRGVRNNPAKTL